MPRGYDRPLYILPFDHRGSFQTKMFGWQSPLSDAQTAEIAGAKQVIYDGFLAALARRRTEGEGGHPCRRAIWRRHPARRRVQEHHHRLSGGEKRTGTNSVSNMARISRRHIEAFDPTFCKVLVRYNPEGDGALNKRQAARLKRLSDFLAARGRSRFMFELLVPAEKMQLDRLAGDKRAYDLELRPRLMVEAIQELQDQGVEPDLWKVEGLDRREDCEQVVAAARAGGRHRSAASFSVAARTTEKFANGSRSRRLCRVSSDLRSAARFSGIRWPPGGANKRRAIRPSPRSPGAIVNLWICSSGKRQACLLSPRRASDRNVVPLWRAKAMQLGMIGLGRMGGNMVRRLLKGGHQCVVYNRSANAVAELVKEKAVGTTSLPDFVKKLTKPRAVWLMVPTGVVDNVIADLLPHLERGDILIDGGNSYYIDDIRRAKELKSKGIHYVDVGTSGGVWGLERGYCMMIGGERRYRETSRSDLRHACAGPRRYSAHAGPRKSQRHIRAGLSALRTARRRPFRQDGA